jgi:hypothetical protein
MWHQRAGKSKEMGPNNMSCRLGLGMFYFFRVFILTNFFYIVYRFHPPTTTPVPPPSLETRVGGGLSLSITHHHTLALPRSKHESEGHYLPLPRSKHKMEGAFVSVSVPTITGDDITGPMFHVLGHKCKFYFIFSFVFFILNYTN